MGIGAITDTANTDPVSFSDWLEQLEEQGETRGYFEPIGKHHSVVFSDEGTTLLVTFERAEDIRADDPSGKPLGWRLSEGQDWSSLCLIAHQDSWFRSHFVYGYFDRLVDDGFFEDFDRVVFYGADMCGYAAAAFSVVATGADIILVSPQATLDPAHADWDKRFPAMRDVSFSDRYGYAPEMCENAGQVFVVFDPEVCEDAMHARLFKSKNVRSLPCRHFGSDIEIDLISMNVLPAVVQAAAKGELDSTLFNRLLKTGRRGYRLRLWFTKAYETAKRIRRRRILIDLTN
ncbi:MAG: phosphoadenosine phosphosulfate reductase [Rhodobacteraceae bacterium]|nr:phosphoadenosine phosphosulfate reductase [Paracoccaceae bacterium]